MVMYGPMQLMVVGFPGNEFSGEIVPALDDARSKGLIRLIDYIFVSKDEEGNLLEIEGTDLGKAEVEKLGAIVGDLCGLGAEEEEDEEEADSESGGEIEIEMTYGLSEEDIDEIVDSLPNDSSALIAIIEHLWAKDLKQAVIDSNGIVLIQGMLAPEIVVGICEELPASASK